RPGTKEYVALKQIAENGKAFYQTYFDKTEKRFDAFVQYIEIYLSISKKFIINFIPGYHDRICELHEAKIKMASDSFADLTRALLKSYNQHVIEQTGTLFIDYSKVPEQYVKFVNAAEICNTLKLPPEVYIKAQFDRFAYFNSIPEPKDLISEKALSAIQRF